MYPSFAMSGSGLTPRPLHNGSLTGVPPTPTLVQRVPRAVGHRLRDKLVQAQVIPESAPAVLNTQPPARTPKPAPELGAREAEIAHGFLAQLDAAQRRRGLSSLQLGACLLHIRKNGLWRVDGVATFREFLLHRNLYPSEALKWLQVAEVFQDRLQLQEGLLESLSRVTLKALHAAAQLLLDYPSVLQAAGKKDIPGLTYSPGQVQVAQQEVEALVDVLLTQPEAEALFSLREHRTRLFLQGYTLSQEAIAELDPKSLARYRRIQLQKAQSPEEFERISDSIEELVSQRGRRAMSESVRKVLSSVGQLTMQEKILLFSSLKVLSDEVVQQLQANPSQPSEQL